MFENFNAGTVILVVLCLTAGSILVMWMGELITQRGIGNGISLMIFASIVAGLPGGVSTVVDEPGPGLQDHHAVPGASASSRRSCSSRKASAGSRSSTPSA